jgi:hypothetical protein
MSKSVRLAAAIALGLMLLAVFYAPYLVGLRALVVGGAC